MKPWEEMSIRERVLQDLYSGTTRTRTAAELAKYADRKLSSVSSEVHDLYKKKILLRVKGFGPRGGYGYVIDPKRKEEVAEMLGLRPLAVPVVFDNPIADRYLSHAGWREDT